MQNFNEQVTRVAKVIESSSSNITFPRQRRQKLVVYFVNTLFSLIQRKITGKCTYRFLSILVKSRSNPQGKMSTSLNFFSII